jgi:hypothetical protein
MKGKRAAVIKRTDKNNAKIKNLRDLTANSLSG